MSTATPSVAVTETHVNTSLRYDPAFAKSMAGMLKIAVTVNNPNITLDLLTFACVVISGAYWRSTGTANWASLVSMTCFWVNITLLIFYTVHVVERFHKIPWLLIELVLDALFAFLLLTVAVDLFLKAAKVFVFGVAAVFASLAIGILVFDGLNKFRAVKLGQIAQGTRIVHKSNNDGRLPNGQ